MKHLILVLFCLGIFGGGLVFGQTTIRETDFQNFTYQPRCGGAETRNFTVKNGLFYEEKSNPGVATKKVPNPKPVIERTYFRPYQFIFTDLNGDGEWEAIILTLCTTGGAGSFSEGFIYGMDQGKPVLLTRIEGGDRALGGLREIKTDRDILTVERSRPGDDGLACCPERIETTDYRFENNGLTQIGDSLVREIYPPTRVQFTEGTTRAGFDLRITKDNNIKRFIVSGRKGQTLRVSTTDPDARIRLFRGNAKLAMEKNPTNQILYYNSTNSLEARLNETGDFIFEISNLSGRDLNITATVEIN